MNDKDVNSSQWWDAYFENNWEHNGGPQQTRAFMASLISALHPVDCEWLSETNRTLMDWGCAFGDGADELAKSFPLSQICGLDSSSPAIQHAKAAYPHLHFIDSSVHESPPINDAVFCSNCLEHFAQPWAVASEIASLAKDFLVFLVPYAESPLLECHIHSFTETDFPPSLGILSRFSVTQIAVPESVWPSGKQLLAVYGSRQFLEGRKQRVDVFNEREKWDAYYADLPLYETDPATAAFNSEFVNAIKEIIPEGSRVLEAGCGGGSQSLALAREGSFAVSLLDFATGPLRHAERLFEHAGVIAEFLQEDVFRPGEPKFDLVFNAGVLEHYSLEEQARFLHGMASRTKRYVLVLIPNRACYWYWLWRLQRTGDEGWPFGREIPQITLQDAFEAAGLNYLGEAFLGEDWTSGFINGHQGIDDRTRDHIIRVHKSGLIPAIHRGYLLAALGSVHAEDTLPPSGVWQKQTQPNNRALDNLTSALVDALAVSVSAQQHQKRLESSLSDSANSLSEVSGKYQQLYTNFQESQNQLALLNQRLAEKNAEFVHLQQLLANHERTIGDLSSQLKQQQASFRNMVTSHSWRLTAPLRFSMRLFRHGLLREDRNRIFQMFRPLAKRLPLSLKTKIWLKQKLLRSPGAINYWGNGALTQPHCPFGEDSHELLPDREVTSFWTPEHWNNRCTPYNVLVLPIIEWNFRFQRPQHLARCFARQGHSVHFCSLTFSEKFGFYGLEPNIWHLSLPGDPATNVYQTLPSGEDTDRIVTALSEYMTSAYQGPWLCIVQLPYWGEIAASLAKHFGCPIVYDCMDDHAGFSSNSSSMLAAEESLIQRADLVIASSQVLYEKVVQAAKQVTLIRNAGEYEHFAQADMGDQPPRAEIRIGYYGAIADWFDSNLVGEISQRRPNWHFDLIGSTYSADTKPLDRHGNIKLQGEKPYTELPELIRNWDCCIIPFKRVPLTEATNPVKIYEMLATGKPVVAVDLPELRPIAEKNLISIADNADEFIACIETELKRNSLQQRNARKLFAQDNTWEKRQSALDKAIRTLYPLVSIIVVTYNNLSYNRLCIESLFNDTDYPNFEIIVIDNASSDGTPEYLASLDHPRLKVILNSENKGFSGGNNQGLACARGEYICLLNNDTVVSGAWLSTLIGHLKRNPKLGLVGPTTNAIGNEAKIPVGYTSLTDMPKWARDRCRKTAGLLTDISMLAFFCVVMPREVYSTVGLLDERFGIGMFEDDDYNQRVRNAGYDILLAHDAFVHHWQRASFKLLGDEAYYSTYEKNSKLYQAKWASRKLSAEQKRQISTLLEKSRQARGTIIFPPTIGWEVALFQRPHHLARVLAQDGYVTVFDSSNSHDNVDLLKEIEPRLFLFKGEPSLLAEIKNPILWTFTYNFDYVDYFSPDTKIIYDWIDDLAVFTHDQGFLRKNHLRALKEASVVATVSRKLDQEARLIRPDTIYLPNAVEEGRFESCPSPNPTSGDKKFLRILERNKPIAGYYGALANWFDYDLLCTVAQARPDWEFVLIGPDHDRSIQTSNVKRQKNISWLGPRDYETLPGYLHAFSVAMIPFKINDITIATSPLKLFEYFAGKKPTVSTPMPECSAFSEVFIASTSDEFSSALDNALSASKNTNFLTRLMDLSQANTWRSRAQSALAAIDNADQNFSKL